MQQKEYLTVRKIADRNTRNRFILSVILGFSSLYFYLSTHVTLIEFMLNPKEKSINYNLVPGATSGIFYASPENNFYVNAIMKEFALIAFVLFIYNITRAIMGAKDYRKSVTYRQLYAIMGDMEQNERAINHELEKNQITSLPDYPQKKVLDNWTVTKRFLKTRFSMNNVDEYKIYRADKRKWE